MCFFVGFMFGLTFKRFMNYTIIARSMEGYRNLLSLEYLQEQYKTKYNNYAKSFIELRWNIKEDNWHEYILCDDVIEARKSTNSSAPIRLPEYLVRCDKNNDYLIYAVGNLDSDPKLDIFVLSNKYGIVHLSDDSMSRISGP
jgi:hypothetical protein